MAGINNSKEAPQSPKEQPLNSEALGRVIIAAKEAMRIIENNPELQDTIRDNLKNSILNMILSNPLLVKDVLDEVDRRFKERLDLLPASERLKAIKWYANLTEKLGHDIANKTLDINLDNAINKARAELDKKTESLRQTYKQIELQLKNETIPKE